MARAQHLARAGQTAGNCRAQTDLLGSFCVQGLLESVVGKSDFEESLTAILTWLRFSSARLLTWNRNYNVKPREISAAQVRSSADLSTCRHSLQAAGPAEKLDHAAIVPRGRPDKASAGKAHYTAYVLYMSFHDIYVPRCAAF